MKSEEAAAEIPASIQALLLARLDRLPHRVRHLAQEAAVIGPRFDAAVLGAAATERASVEAGLELLCDAEIIEEVAGSNSISLRTYRFTQTMLQDVIYQNLLLQRRIELHGRIGAALERLYGNEPERLEDLALLGHHFSPESKMTEIERARSWSPRVISKFETLITSGDDLSLFRVNPLAFARDRAIAEPESIDLFLHATRSGLFEMSWDVVCPQSCMALDSFGALRTLKTHYVYGLCDVTGETDLDNFIEVTFTVSPQLRRLPFHDPASLSVEDFHWKLRWPASRRPDRQSCELHTMGSVFRLRWPPYRPVPSLSR